MYVVQVAMTFVVEMSVEHKEMKQNVKYKKNSDL